MFKTKHNRIANFPCLTLLLIILSNLVVCLSVAGEATEVIEEALQAYNKEDLNVAADALNEAIAIVLQEKAARMETKCPKAIDGWKKDKTVSNSSAGSVFGGGTVTECKYSNDKNKITISFTTDSPMLQSMMVLFNNPMFANSDGGKIKRIKADGKKHKAIIKYDENRKTGEITSIFENILVGVKGRASEDELMSYFKSIKFSSLVSG